MFIEEQELLRRLVRESILPTLELDISDNDVTGAVDRIADWMTETGGLWAKVHDVLSLSKGDEK